MEDPVMRDEVPLTGSRSWRCRFARMKHHLMKVLGRMSNPRRERDSIIDIHRDLIVVDGADLLPVSLVQSRLGEEEGKDMLPVEETYTDPQPLVCEMEDLGEEGVRDEVPEAQIEANSEKVERDNFPEDVDNVSEEFDVESDSEGSSECGLANVPFAMMLECSSSELPEDIERLIFEIFARAYPSQILKTLVYVNHRIKKWVEYVLYETVLLRDAKHARLFLKGLDQKHPEFAAGAVKILELPTRVSYDTSFRILKACKNIHHLSWLPINPLAVETVSLISELPLISLRARLIPFLGNDPDFSSPLFKHLTTLFIADHHNLWKNWKWAGLKIRPNVKWIAVNLDDGLTTFAAWKPVKTIENKVLKPYGGPFGVQLCICYQYKSGLTGCRWIHRTEQTFSDERMVILSLGHRVEGEHWVERVVGDCRDFEMSEKLVKERQKTERRLHFACE